MPTAATESYEVAGARTVPPVRASAHDRLSIGSPDEGARARLSTLPRTPSIYYLVVNRTAPARASIRCEYLDRLAAIANAPIYCWVDSAMDHGIVGGSLKSQEAEAEAIGRLALRVLRGERADSIPVSSPTERPAGRLAPAAAVGHQRSARAGRRRSSDSASLASWDRYRIYILGAAAVVLWRRRPHRGTARSEQETPQAEEQVLRRPEAELRTSYERIRDLGARLLKAQETERSRIARELHDDISQQVALLEIDLELLSVSRG